MNAHEHPHREESTDPDTSVRASAVARARMERAGRATAEKHDVDRGRRGSRKRLSQPATGPVVRPARRFAPLFAFLVVGGLGAVMALPAYADFDPSSADSSEVVATRNDAGQSVEAQGGQVISSRDGLAAAYSRPSTQLHVNVHYTNNPNGIIQWPFSYFVPVSDMFGEREAPCAGCSTMHAGTDFDANEGDPIQSIADGVVSTVNLEDNGGDGLFVNITHNVNGMTFMSRYCHLAPGSISVVEGQVVSVAQIIGQVGVSGASTGSHLHFELHTGGVAVDPFAWLTEHAG